MGQNSIKVDMNGDGKDIRNVAPGDIDRFLAANPGASRVDGEAPVQASEPEVEASEDMGDGEDEGSGGPRPRASRARKE